MKHHNSLYISIVFICVLLLGDQAKAGSDLKTDNYKWLWRTITLEKYEIPPICNIDSHSHEDIAIFDDVDKDVKEILSSLFEVVLEIKKDYHATDPKIIDTLTFISRVFLLLNENTTHVPHFIAQQIAQKYLKLDEDKYTQYVLYSHMEHIERICGFLITLQEHIQKPREKLISKARLQSPEWQPISIVMAGAGPVGLMSAIEAYSQGIIASCEKGVRDLTHFLGATPELFEKRNNYTRNTWFDLEPLPWSTTKLKLNKWGIQFQDLERVLHDENEEIDSSNIRVTMRTLTLEKYLSKVAAILGIKINFGWKFISVCDNDSALFIRSRDTKTPAVDQQCVACNQEANENVVKKEFNVLLGSEGTQSIVRQLAGIEWAVQNTFEFVPFKMPHELVRSKQVRSVSVNDLQQVSALVNFKPINGECPRLNQGQNQERLDPLYPTFVIPGVISVWKRFFSGDACQLQLLFNNSVGHQIVEQFKNHAVNDEAYPWHHIHQVVNLLFEEPVTSIDQVKQLIATKNNSQHGREVFSIEVLPVKIYRASSTLKPITNSKNHIKILSIAGDASVTAHFRLGVGINNAFLGLQEFSKMMRQLSMLGANKMDVDHVPDLTKIITEKENSSNERLSRLVQFELSTMYYESYCDFVLFFDDNKENYWERQSLYRPNRKKNTFVPVLDAKLQECYERAIKSA